MQKLLHGDAPETIYVKSQSSGAIFANYISSEKTIKK